MRITGRWTLASGESGRMPEFFCTTDEAEQAARQLMAKYSGIVLVSISHETGGWLTDVLKDGTSTNGWSSGR